MHVPAHGFIQSKSIVGSKPLTGRSTHELLSTLQYRTRAVSSSLLSSSDDNSSSVNKRQANGMAILPQTVVKYSTVPKDKYFTIDTIPTGLLKEHSTKKGTWGVIRVHQGKLEYTILEPEQSVHILDAECDNVGIIEPTCLHQTRGLTDDLKFVVEFYRVPGSGDVDEQREGL